MNILAINYAPLSLDNAGSATIKCELSFGGYDPPFDLKGKTVLDIGATCGEVAYYYIKKFHADKVICVECDPKRLPYLKTNAVALDGRIVVVPEPFSLKHLEDFNYDFIKCDVEGYEMLLIDYLHRHHQLAPTVLEAHTNWIKDQFLQWGFHITQPLCTELAFVATYLMRNY